MHKNRLPCNKISKILEKKKKEATFFFFYHLPNELTAVFIHKLFLTPTVCKSAAESLVYKGGWRTLQAPAVNVIIKELGLKQVKRCLAMSDQCLVKTTATDSTFWGFRGSLAVLSLFREELGCEMAPIRWGQSFPIFWTKPWKRWLIKKLQPRVPGQDLNMCQINTTVRHFNPYNKYVDTYYYYLRSRDKRKRDRDHRGKGRDSLSHLGKVPHARTGYSYSRLWGRTSWLQTIAQNAGLPWKKPRHWPGNRSLWGKQGVWGQACEVFKCPLGRMKVQQ